jgi:uncharacterized protein (DUF4415 family)
MRRRGESQTDLARIDAMTKEELEAAIDKDEEGHFEGSVGYPGIPGVKRETTLLLDDQVIQWFRLQGPDYLEQMNDVLLEYVVAQREQPGRHRKR